MVAHYMRSAGIAGFGPTARQSGRAGVALLVSVLLGGCASFSADRGMDAVSGLTSPALKADVVALRSEDDIAVADARVAALLKRPLNADAAVQIALLNNRDLQAYYKALGIVRAHTETFVIGSSNKVSSVRSSGSSGNTPSVY